MIFSALLFAALSAICFAISPLSNRGEVCNNEKRCDSKLTCQDGICKVQVGMSCLGKRSFCMNEHRCMANPNQPFRKHCFRMRKSGESCGLSVFEVCTGRSVCIDKVCKLPIGKSCAAEGSVCMEGLKCIAKHRRPSVKLCMKVTSHQQECGYDIFTVCKHGQRCSEKVCKVPLGRSCTHNRAECIPETICISNPGNSSHTKCVKPMSAGEKCGIDPFWVCKPELSCEHKVCKIPMDGDCTKNQDLCVKGTVCAGRQHKMKCVKPMPVGKPCGNDPFWVCEPGRFCDGNRCAGKNLPAGEDCRSGLSTCKEGLKCVGAKRRGKRKICVEPLRKFEACENSYMYICEDGFTCFRKKCVPKGSIASRIEVSLLQSVLH